MIKFGVSNDFMYGLEPSSELLTSIFPWVEQEQLALQRRANSNPMAKDIALKGFLGLLLWLRRVLIQDCAVLYSQYPNCAMFRFAPFNTLSFRAFAQTSAGVIARAEEEARRALQNLPEHVAATFRGLTTDIKLDQESQRVVSDARWAEMQDQMYKLTGLVTTIAGAKSARGRTKASQGI